MVALKIIQIGNSHCGGSAKAVLANVEIEKGGTIYFTQTLGHHWQLSPYGDEIAREIVLGEEIMEQYSETFRMLAK